MFNFSRLPGHRPSGGNPPQESKEPTIRLLVMTADFDYSSHLRVLANGCGWSIRAAATLEEIIPHVQDSSFPLVVYDWNAADDWRAAFDRLRAVNSGACLLLASPVADPYLWQEVIEAGGFDLLSRTAPQDELIQKLRFAWFSMRRTPLPPNSPDRGAHA